MLTKLGFHTRKDVCRQVVTEEPPALVEPLQVMLKAGADSSRVKAKLRPMPPDEEQWLEN